MELLTQTVQAVQAKAEHSGSQSFEVTAGQALKIETSPEGTEVLDMTVPAGKKWQVVLKIHITETNA